MNRFITRVGWICCFSAVGTAMWGIPCRGENIKSATEASPANLTLGDIDGFLAGARQAMSQGDLTKAEGLLRRAEAAKPKYPVLHFGDTPARVRRDLDKMVQAGGAPVSKPAAQTTNQLANPFASQLATPKPQPQTSAKTQVVAVAPSPENRRLAQQAVLAARQAMLVGDTTLARKHLEQSLALNVQFGEAEDSPQKVAQSLTELEQLQSAKNNSPSWRQSYAKFLVAQGENLLARGDLDNAERAATEAAGLMDLAGSGDPAAVTLVGRVKQARQAQNKTHANRTIVDQSVAPAAAALPVDLTLPDFPADQPVPKLAQIPTALPEPLPATESLAPEMMDGFALLQEGEIALKAGDRTQALKLFRMAFQRRMELDQESQQLLQDHLQMLTAGENQPKAAAPQSDNGSMLDEASSGQAVIARQLSAEIGKRQAEAGRLRESDPRKSLSILEEAGELVTKSELDENTKTQLTRRLSLSIAETERYIKDHEADIELNEANSAALADVEREREVRQQVQDKMEEMIKDFNQLKDEHRYAEAEVIAKRIYELAPEEMAAQQVWEMAKFIRREMLNQEIAAMSEEGFVKTMQDVEQSKAEALLQASDPIQFADNWEDIKNRRQARDPNAYRSKRELEIERKLRTPVLPSYTDMPLSEVIDSLSKLVGVNIHLDPRGLGQEGVQTDTPVTLNLSTEVSLNSALSLILEPLHLTYMVKDEVLKITSEQIRDGELKFVTYNVADLVIPIPNFIPSNNMGLQGMINDAYAGMRFSNGMQQGGPVAMATMAPPGQPAGAVPGGAMAQFGGASPGSSSVPASGGPGGLGGAANADFDSLIDLITSTVEYDTWMENGSGEGEIQPFPTNLSLVISQTQKVHDQIRDLLDQLRSLQDLQVTIEVRFIRLRDSFFERIGVDFDFNIEDGTTVSDLVVNSGGTPTSVAYEPPLNSRTVGSRGNPTNISDPTPDYTVDLDVPFRNDSFTLTVPQIGSPQAVGQFGFAILSDIEAFFLIEASQGDQRSNVLQAPKVTLFNGQQGLVADTSLRPFVISVIPVVGEFVAAQQPVIVVLSEGTLLTVQAVVSDDRRYVRLTLVPFFSSIGNVDTFTFEGTETTSNSSNTTDGDEDGNDEKSDVAEQKTTSGTTVQLPTFQVVTVATTVSVPDGGTVLLGGVKRLSEGRNEFGVPLLSKVPYVDRLFRNVGIGRETDSLMMMVTPHIIIQEEEEERLGIKQE